MISKQALRWCIIIVEIIFLGWSVIAVDPGTEARIALQNTTGAKEGNITNNKYDFQKFFFLQNDFHVRNNKSSAMFTLFTPDCQQGERLLIGRSIINKTCFNPENELKILIHGYTEMGHSINSMVPIRLAYFRANRSVNVLVLDWSLHSVDWNYLNSAKHLDEVGNYLSTFLNYLQTTTGFKNTSNIHLIGFSLGAHVAGLAGRHFYALTGQKIGRISGLDPAGPKFHLVLAKDRIRLDDADFLDFIHGDTDTYGGNFQGHANFYPNGGKKQPGCATPFATFIGCGHRKTPQWFAESILYPRRLIGCRCTDLDDFKEDKCSCINRNDLAVLGEHCSPLARGKFFLLVRPGEVNYAFGIYPNLISLAFTSNGTVQNQTVPHIPVDHVIPTIPSINFNAFDAPGEYAN